MPHVNELHEQHDPILVVSFASGDLSAADRDYATAQTLVGSCAECARLHDDILAIASATKALPPPVRTRDFRITNEQAAKLRPAGLRGVLSRLTAPGALFSRQLGVGLATLGVAGLLIGSLPMNLGMGGAASAPAASQPASATEQAAQAPAASAPAASAWPDQVFSSSGGGAAEAEASVQPYHDTSAPQPSSQRSSSGRNVVGGAAASAAPASAAPAAAGTPTPDDENATLSATADSGSSGGPSPLIVVSALLLAAGILVLLVRRLGRAAVSG